MDHNTNLELLRLPNRRDPMRVFPPEVLVEIFSHIVDQGSLLELKHTQDVSRYWYNHINQSGFWKLVLSPSERKKYKLWLVATIERMSKFTGTLKTKMHSNLNLNGVIGKRRRLKNAYDKIVCLIKNGFGYKLFLEYNRIVNNKTQEYVQLYQNSFLITKVFDDYKYNMSYKKLSKRLLTLNLANPTATVSNIVSLQKQDKNIKEYWTYRFVTLDCGEFILRYNNETTEVIIFDNTLQFSGSFNIIKEFNLNNTEFYKKKIEKVNGLGDNNETDPVERFSTKMTEADWFLFNIRAKGDYIILFHSIAVSLIKVEISYDIHDRLKSRNIDDELKTPIDITYMSTIIYPYMVDFLQQWKITNPDKLESVDYWILNSHVHIEDCLLDPSNRKITFVHSDEKVEQLRFEYVKHSDISNIPGNLRDIIYQNTCYTPETPFYDAYEESDDDNDNNGNDNGNNNDNNGNGNGNDFGNDYDYDNGYYDDDNNVVLQRKNYYPGIPHYTTSDLASYRLRRLSKNSDFALLDGHETDFKIIHLPTGEVTTTLYDFKELISVPPECSETILNVEIEETNNYYQDCFELENVVLAIILRVRKYDIIWYDRRVAIELNPRTLKAGIPTEIPVVLETNNKLRAREQLEFRHLYNYDESYNFDTSERSTNCPDQFLNLNIVPQFPANYPISYLKFKSAGQILAFKSFKGKLYELREKIHRDHNGFHKNISMCIWKLYSSGAKLFYHWSISLSEIKDYNRENRIEPIFYYIQSLNFNDDMMVVGITSYDYRLMVYTNRLMVYRITTGKLLKRFTHPYLPVYRPRAPGKCAYIYWSTSELLKVYKDMIYMIPLRTRKLETVVDFSVRNKEFILREDLTVIDFGTPSIERMLKNNF